MINKINYMPQSLRKKINKFLQENNLNNTKRRINEAYDDEEFDDESSSSKIPDYQSMPKQVKAYRQYVKDGIFTKEFQGMLANTVDTIAARKQGISVEELQLRKKKGNEDKQQSMTDIEKNRLFYYICWLKGNKLWKDLFMRFMDASVANDQQWEENEKFRMGKSAFLSDLDDAEDYLDKREKNKDLNWQSWDYNEYAVPRKDERVVQEWKKFKIEFGKALADALLVDFTRDKYNALSNKRFRIGTSEKSFVEWSLKSGVGGTPETIVDSDFVSREYQDAENLTAADYYFGEANKLFTRTVGINPSTGEFKKGYDFPEEVLDEIDKKYEKNPYNQIDFEIDSQQKKMELAEESDDDIENDRRFSSQYASRRDDPFLNPTRPANMSDEEWEEYLAFRRADYEESQQIEKENRLKRQGKPVGPTVKRQDRLYEYQKILNEVQKMFDLPFFEPHNLSKNVDDEGQFNEFIDTSFVDDVDEDTDYDDDGTSYSTKGMIKDVLTSAGAEGGGEVQNVDKFIELMLLYAEFTAKLTFLKVSGAIKKSQAAMLAKQADSKINEEIDKNLKNVILMIYSKINELGPRYPDVTHKLGSCAREIDMYRSKIFNMRSRDKFWTLPSLVSVTGGLYKLETSGKPVATSGLQRSIAQMLMQATWAQQMLRTNKIGDLRVISFQSWLDMLDSEYYSSFGFQKKIDEKTTIEQKLQELVAAAKKEKSGFRYKKPEKIKDDRSQKLKKDVIKSLSKNKKYDELNALFVKLEDSIEEIKEELDILMSGSTSAYLSDTSRTQEELNDYIVQYNEIKSKISRIENIARRNARSAQYSDTLKRRKDAADSLAAKAGEEEDKELDIEISEQIKNVSELLADMGMYDLRMYKKNKAGGKDLGPLSFSKTERDPELSADYIFNQAQVAKYDTSSKKLSVDPGLEKAMRNYYKYPDTFDEYVTSDPRAKFYDSMHQVDVGVDIAPMYIEKLMTDKKSPFRNYHGILVSKFFDNERVASYTYDSGNKKFAGTVPDAINEYMRAEWNPDFGLATITNDVGREVRNPGFEGDVLFTQKICEYALGFSNTDYDASLKKSALLEQNPQDFVKDLEKYWNKDFSKSMTQCTLIPDFNTNSGIRSAFWNEIAISSTTELDRVPENVKRLKRPLGNIAKAVMVKLYDPNIEKHYQEFIDGLSEPLKAKIFNQSLNATEFYNLFKSDTIVEPDDYYKDKK